MKFNSPIPQALPKECDKACKIFRSFVDSRNAGLDGVIPRVVLEQAKGFAVFSVFKAGFVFSARAGSGIVIVRLPDGTWSAPSAIGTAGLGVGMQTGAEVTDFLIVLNSRSAVKSFMSAGSLSLGGNMSIAVGPLGRNGEALGSVNSSGKLAAMYSYSKTRGLFGGVSLEGSVIVERQDANAIAYGSDVTVRQLLGGQTTPPPWAENLVKTIESCTGLPGGRKWVQDDPRSLSPSYAFGGVSSPNTSAPTTPGSLSARLKKPKHSSKPSFPPASWDEPMDSYFPTSASGNKDSGTTSFDTQFRSDFAQPQSTRQSSYGIPATSPTGQLVDIDSYSEPNSGLARDLPRDPIFDTIDRDVSQSQPKTENPFSPKRASTIAVPHIEPKPELTQPLLPGEGLAKVIALYDFHAVEPGDLGFSKGDVITVTRKSDSMDDWWEGKLGGRSGSFPANFCEVAMSS